jgi:hypothetical protein
LKVHKCFFISPIDDNFHRIKPILFDLLATHNIKLISLEEISLPEVSLDKTITHLISSVEFIIADISNQNSNIFFELGIAYALNKKIIIISKQKESIPFDLLSQKVIHYNSNLEDIDLFKKTINFFLEELESDKKRKLKTVEKTLTFKYNIESEKDDNYNLSKLDWIDKFIYFYFKNSGFTILNKPQYSKIFDLVMVAPSKSNLPQNALWLLESKKRELTINEISHISSYLDKRSNIGIIVTSDPIDQLIYKKVKENAQSGIFLILLTIDELKQFNDASQFLHLIEEKFKELLFLSKYGG